MMSKVRVEVGLLLLFLMLIVFPLNSFAEKPIFEYIREIGSDDDEDYLFAKITCIAISDQKEIYVADSKLVTIRKFNWNGQLVTKAGQRGKGPGDFIFFEGIQCLGDKIYITDWYNQRIAVSDATLKKFDYIRVDQLFKKLNAPFPIRNAPIFLDHNKIFAIISNYDEEEGRLLTFDKEQDIIQRFFCSLPADIADKKDSNYFSILTHPIICNNIQKKQILTTFEHPDQELQFYLYDYSGQLIRQFSYMQDKEYRFPTEKLEYFRYTPSHRTVVLDIFGFENYYMIFLVNMIDFDKPREKRKTNFYFLFFRETGEFMYKIPWNVRFFTISSDGYLGGVHEIDDVVKVMIYKFNPEALEEKFRKEKTPASK